MGRFHDIMEKHRKLHEDERKWKEEYRNKHSEYHFQQYELKKRYRDSYKGLTEVRKYHNHIRLIGPAIILLSLLIWYLVFSYGGLQLFSIIIAVLISLACIFQFFFLRRIEKRILNPIIALKDGVEEIAKGNYNIKVEKHMGNEIGVLVDSFNEMAQKLAEGEKLKAEYEENRKTLIANISHDLKTPITSIQGYIEAIQDGSVVTQENINKYLKIINNNTTYIDKLIDDLFLFSKLDMQKLEFKFEKTQVRPFMNDLLEEFKYELEEKKIQLNYIENMNKDCSFNIDMKRMHQVFNNIIGNAVKYGPAQDLMINIELYSKDDFVLIDIKDNGQGIPEDQISSIFDRFYRIDSERTKDFMSTGLGLAIAKELIEAHGGQISVTSVQKEGTCFTIKLPAIQ